jgi:hypothetical protein
MDIEPRMGAIYCFRDGGAIRDDRILDLRV